MGSNGMASSPFFHPNFMLQMQIPHEEEEHFTNPQPFVGAAAMLGRRKRSMSFLGIEPCEEDDLSDDCSQAGGEKKRRLGAEQVRALERTFEQGNKLDPERKMQLARTLGLQPRQIAIWFQNRRARWKTKQLERDYELLKQQFDAIKADNDALQSLNKKLQAEMLGLRCKESSELINLNKETVEGSSEENSSEVNVEGPIDHHPQQSIPFFTSLRPPPSMAQFLHASSRSELRCPKIDSMVADENFSNLLCSVEDQSAFWPWPDHNAFH